MRWVFVLGLLLVGLCCGESSAEDPFARNNPDYRTRAGSFYEAKYLPGAVEGLVAVFAPQVLTEDQAGDMLRGLIYDFLDAYTAGGGRIRRRAHTKVLATLDEQVAALADDPSILKRYAEWKSGGSKGYPNPLSFLTRVAAQSPPLDLALDDGLERAGWHVRSLESLDETGRYGDVLGLEPYQVILVQRDRNGNRENAFTLLLFHENDAAELPQAMAAYNESATAASVRLFWRTRKLIVCNLEPESPMDATALKEWIRTQWLGA